MRISPTRASSVLALALALALPACASDDQTETATTTTSMGDESADTFHDMPADGVNERSATGPARVAPMRDDGDPYPEYILVDPAIPESRIAFDIERLHEVCGDPSVYFETDSAELSADGLETIGYLAECIKSEDVRSVAITGHTDERGSTSYNEDLGQQRAERVAELLRQHGVSEPEIRVESMGEQAARYGLFWPEDRRVDIDTQPSG